MAAYDNTEKIIADEQKLNLAINKLRTAPEQEQQKAAHEINSITSLMGLHLFPLQHQPQESADRLFAAFEMASKAIIHINPSAAECINKRREWLQKRYAAAVFTHTVIGDAVLIAPQQGFHSDVAF